MVVSSLRISPLKKKTFLVGFLVFLAVLVTKIVIVRDGFQVGGFEDFLDFLLWFMLVYSLVELINVVAASSYRKRLKLPAEHFDNFTVGITTASYLVKFAAAIFLFLFIFRVDLQFFLTSLGLFSVALAWIFKEYIGNIIDGLIILFSENLKIKDYIKVEEYKGVINHITLLETELKTDEGDIVHVPNTLILDKPVTNYSKARVKTINYSFELSKKNFTKVEALEEFLKYEVPEHFPEVMQRETFYFKIDEIRSEKILISLQIPVRKFNFDIEENIRKFVSLQIIRFFRENNA